MPQAQGQQGPQAEPEPQRSTPQIDPPPDRKRDGNSMMERVGQAFNRTFGGDGPKHRRQIKR